jgi:hypothetical protein
VPLHRIPADIAVANRKNNFHSGWGDRSLPNRVEPIARPVFKASFSIAPRSKIFTVGSCFARNVEDELIRRGFELPTRLVQVEDSSVLNNYGAASIFNEFAWAFGERPFVPQDHIVEVAPGKFADLHMPPNRRPQPYADALARRESIMQAYRQAAECSVIVMTLGLVESWFDTRTGYYLNVGPRPSQIRAEPERFELHVLSFEECHDFLERTIGIIRRHGRPDVRMLLTVSPVPLTNTHRDEDVIVANMYSKSVLRAVAETVVARHEFIAYYPSYESVMYSDRQRAWLDDMVHVRDEIVALNVGRMVEAYVGAPSLAELREELRSRGVVAAVEAARRMRAEASEEAARAFFAEFGDLSRESQDFALEEAYFCEGVQDHRGVLAALAAAPPGLNPIQTVPLQAFALGSTGRAAEGLALFEDYLRARSDPAHKIKSWGFWQTFLNTALLTSDEEVILATLQKVALAHVNYRPWAYNRVGAWFLEHGRFDMAVAYLRMALDTGGVGELAHLMLAEAYASLGMKKEARSALDSLPPAQWEAWPRAVELKQMLA